MKKDVEINSKVLLDVARTSLRTKVHAQLADVLADFLVDSILTIKQDDKPVDLHIWWV